MTFNLGIDIDGVLACFDIGYRQALHRVSGHHGTIKREEEPDRWHWPVHYGWTQQDDHNAWAEIKGDPNFWAGLPAYPEAPFALRALLMAAAEGHNVYFLTNRPGQQPHTQTVRWLRSYGYPFPSVLLCPEVKGVSTKGLIARGLQLTHVIDDKPENLDAVLDTSPATTCILRARGWNVSARERLAARGVQIVTDLGGFFDILARDEEIENAQCQA
jgi:hypothetical protein